MVEEYVSHYLQFDEKYFSGFNFIHRKKIQHMSFITAIVFSKVITADITLPFITLQKAMFIGSYDSISLLELLELDV